MAATGTLALNNRVWHIADRNRPLADRRIGTVKKIFTVSGDEFARVEWDKEPGLLKKHPTANLTKVV